MRIGFMVNNIRTEEEQYTTTHLAMAASNREHEVWYVDAGAFSCDQNGQILGRAHVLPPRHHRAPHAFLGELESKSVVVERRALSELDILMLRSDPSLDTGERSWAQETGILFGRVARDDGVIVLNDPDGLSRAINKMYCHDIPQEIRPTTLVSRDPGEIRAFVDEQGGRVILKPLLGSGGHNVFLARSNDAANLGQMIEAISRDGYVVAQEYLPAAKEGDLRLFLVNGLPLRVKGRYAAFRRIHSRGDVRTNISAGGRVAKATVNDDALRIAEIVRPKLVRDGMFFVGLDIVRDKLIEINVFSPAGLDCAHEVEGISFTHAIIRALERKVRGTCRYRRRFDNVKIATL